jgi:NADH-quinone oxidoreductase subunit C
VDEDDARVPSSFAVWPGFDWYEREAWDLYGVRFEGHPNHTRIMMWEGFEGHPLRKDYPINKRQPLTTLLGEQK